MTNRKRKDATTPRSGNTRAERNIAWIEKYCRVPEGVFVGKPLKLREWQKEIIREIYDGHTSQAIISFGRKNGKTTLAAVLLLLHLVGPEYQQNSELYSTGLAREQAAITFRRGAQMVRLSQELRDLVDIRDTVKELYCGARGTLYRALSADASTAMGGSAAFVVHDELGQVSGEHHALYDALETAAGAYEDSLSVVISTQAPTDADLFSRLIDDARDLGLPHVKVFVYEADEKVDPFSEEALRQANPAFRDFLIPKKVLEFQATAKRLPSREAAFRNLHLNQRVETFNILIPKSVWDKNAGQPEISGPVYGGLDLSQTKDLTALVLMDKDLSVECTFWLPEEGLADRSREDRVPYDTWHKQGFLEATPGTSIDYDYVARYLWDLSKQYDIRKIAFDRFNMRHLKPCLYRAGFSEDVVEEIFEDFGQGFVSMSPAIRTMEAMCLNGSLKHGGHPVLTFCNANAVVKMDEAGNRKLDKKRSRGRIDGMVALAMACAMVAEDKEEHHVYPVPPDRILEQSMEA